MATQPPSRWASLSSGAEWIESSWGLLSRVMVAGGVMLVATVVSNAANYAFSLVVGRQLGPQLFGDFTALLGVLTVIAVASLAVQTVVSRFVTEIRRDSGEAASAAFARQLVVSLTILGTALFVFVWLPVSWPLSELLNVGLAAAIATGTALIFGLSFPVYWGVLQGHQDFGRLGRSMIVVAGGRFLIGVGLVAIGAGVAGAIGAISIISALALATAYPYLSRLARPRRQRVEVPLGRILRFGLPTIMAIGAWTILTNLDVVLVNAMAGEDDAGYYGAAATIGKIALFLPIAAGLVIFPKSTARHVAGLDSRSIIRWAGRALVAVGAILVGVCALWSDVITLFMFGTEFAPAADLLVPIVTAMSCFALANVLIFYYLSVHRMTFAWALCAIVVLQVSALSLTASDPLAAARVQMAIGILLLVVNELFFVPLVRPLRSRDST